MFRQQAKHPMEKSSIQNTGVKAVKGVSPPAQERITQ